jgi:homoaconitase/3-isopropylmalate dehydratase large subunit
MTFIPETTISSAILAIKADAQVTVTGEDADNIEWHDGNPTNITNEQILAKQAELQAEYDAQDYARKRQAEYPTIEELVVALYDTDDKAAIDEKRAAVKLKYLKP